MSSFFVRRKNSLPTPVREAQFNPRCGRVPASSQASYPSLPPAAKARSFRCSSFPHQTRFAGLWRGPRRFAGCREARKEPRSPRPRKLHIHHFRLRRKLAHSAARPFPTKPASLGFGGGPGGSRDAGERGKSLVALVLASFISITSACGESSLIPLLVLSPPNPLRWVLVGDLICTCFRQVRFFFFAPVESVLQNRNCGCRLNPSGEPLNFEDAGRK